MHRHTNLSQKKSLLKRTLDDLFLSRKSSNSNYSNDDYVVGKDIQNHSLSNDITHSSSATLNRSDELMKDQGTSTDAVLDKHQSKQVRKIFHII